MTLRSELDLWDHQAHFLCRSPAGRQPWRAAPLSEEAVPDSGREGQPKWPGPHLAQEEEEEEAGQEAS